MSVVRTWCITSIGLVTLAGCSPPTAQLTPQQFQAVYAAPRSRVADFTEYRGVKNGAHRLDVYSLEEQSVAHRIGVYTVPANKMPSDFPKRPQPPIANQSLSPQEQQEWSTAWRKLPRFE